MDALAKLLEKAAARPGNLSTDELATLIALRDPAEIRRAQAAAYALKLRHVGARVALRGLIELGNVCVKDCFYCGIRRSNASCARYTLTAEDVTRLARFTAEARYASLVLQGGENESAAHTAFVEDCLRRIAPFGLGVTLSLGEQDETVYRRWKAAGAARYLLRIETSNRDLYAALHPADHSWERRRDCLLALRRAGYQVGTGTMSALPGQTDADLARDIVFFREMDVDMIGMGPYIPHPDTPLARTAPALPKEERLRLGLNMIAATRLYLHDVNIAATTALQALAEDGRERGLLAGANVIMPNVTDVRYRSAYRLYAGKPGLDENAADARTDLEARVAVIGETIAYDTRGDSAHYFNRLKEKPT